MTEQWTENNSIAFRLENVTEHWTANSPLGFKPTEEQKILAAVRDVLLSDEFIEELAARIISRETAERLTDLDTIERTRNHLNESEDNV